jgi:ketosteroid isomerase-like protein
MSLAQDFIDALSTLEQDRDEASLARLFSDDARCGNVATHHEFVGRAGARDFWRAYRSSFGDVASRFRNVIESGGRIVLEWTTEGTSAAGIAVHYAGVSVIEHDGERITRFHAYFDPRALGRQIERAIEPRDSVLSIH